MWTWNAEIFAPFSGFWTSDLLRARRSTKFIWVLEIIRYNNWLDDKIMIGGSGFYSNSVLASLFWFRFQFWFHENFDSPVSVLVLQIHLYFGFNFGSGSKQRYNIFFKNW